MVGEWGRREEGRDGEGDGRGGSKRKEEGNGIKEDEKGIQQTKENTKNFTWLVLAQ